MNRKRVLYPIGQLVKFYRLDDLYDVDGGFCFARNRLRGSEQSTDAVVFDRAECYWSSVVMVAGARAQTYRYVPLALTLARPRDASFCKV